MVSETLLARLESESWSNQDEVEKLCDRAVELSTMIEEYTETTKELKRQYDTLIHKTIPETFSNIGIACMKNGVQLNNGRTLIIKDKVVAHIPVKDEQRSEKAFEWLRKNGMEGLIKTKVSVTFDRGDEDKASNLVSWLSSKGVKADPSTRVDPRTLNRVARELLEENKIDAEGMNHLNVQILKESIIK